VQKYWGKCFGWDDQVQLAERLAEHRGPVVMSNEGTDRIVDLYRSLGYSLEFVRPRRCIRARGWNRREVLAWRNLAPGEEQAMLGTVHRPDAQPGLFCPDGYVRIGMTT
jgi:hypothetical protein